MLYRNAKTILFTLRGALELINIQRMVVLTINVTNLITVIVADTGKTVAII